MKDRKGRSKERKKTPFAIWVFAAVLFSFMLSLFLGQGGMLRLREMRSHADAMQMENHRLAVENRKMSQEIRLLRQDPATLEKVAREEMHFVSPGDLVLLVPQQEQ